MCRVSAKGDFLIDNVAIEDWTSEAYGVHSTEMSFLAELNLTKPQGQP